MADRDRKVRGQRIRQSRDEKRTDGSAGMEAGRPDAAGGEPTGFGEAVAAEQFVETEAVAAVRERVERWLAADRPVHLVGPTGCGKTALAMAVARQRGRPVVFVNGDEHLTTADLVGEYGELERESVRDRYVHNVMKSKDVVRDRWVDNPLTVAVREGATLVYNEFSRSKPAANNILLSVFEEGVLELPGKRGEDRYVEVHPEFRAILTSNPVEYAGVHTPQDALLDRLIGVHMDFYDRETEVAIVGEHVPEVPTETVERVVDVFRRLRAEEAVEATIGTRAMIMAAEGLAVGGSAEGDAVGGNTAAEGEAVGGSTAAEGDAVDEGLLISVCVDALSSKVADRAGVDRLREAVAAAVAGEA